MSKAKKRNRRPSLDELETLLNYFIERDGRATMPMVEITLFAHDLRHECASWLFEMGWDIPRVSGVTGHKSWSSLQRYTHLRALDIKDKCAGWVWLP